MIANIPSIVEAAAMAHQILCSRLLRADLWNKVPPAMKSRFRISNCSILTADHNLYFGINLCKSSITEAPLRYFGRTLGS
jgi:hypothetical protein